MFFVLLIYSFSGPWIERADFLGALLLLLLLLFSISVVISLLPASLAHSPGSIRQRENWGIHHSVVSWVLKSLAWILLPSLLLSESFYISFMYNIQSFYLDSAGRIGKSKCFILSGSRSHNGLCIMNVIIFEKQI